MQITDVKHGDGPIILGHPHGGTAVPDAIAATLNDTGAALADTDWHIARLFEGLLPDATVVASRVHRYVIDANRDPAGISLYPGQNTTGLVPLTDFDGVEIWAHGHVPDPKEIETRRQAYHAPYHAAMRAEIARVKARHGGAILFDCHSIRSHIPFLFEGTLPVFNVGTNAGVTCAPIIQEAVTQIAQASGLPTVCNGRFKGGWTTRHYGQPDTGVHAIQLEIAQRAYMHEAPPWKWHADRAAVLRPHLQAMLRQLSDIAQAGVLHQERSDT